jgi:hypothetical protein
MSSELNELRLTELATSIPGLSAVGARGDLGRDRRPALLRQRTRPGQNTPASHRGRICPAASSAAPSSPAKAARAAMLTAVDKGYTPAPRSLTFGEYAASWLEIRSRHVRPITANAYRPCVNHAVRAFGARRLADISRADVERLAAALDTAGR